MKRFFLFSLLIALLLATVVVAQGPEDGVITQEFSSVEEYDSWWSDKPRPQVQTVTGQVQELSVGDECAFGTIEIDESTAGPLTMNSPVLDAKMRPCTDPEEFWFSAGSTWAGNAGRTQTIYIGLRVYDSDGAPVIPKWKTFEASNVPETDGVLVIHHKDTNLLDEEVYHYVLEALLVEEGNGNSPMGDFSWWLRHEPKLYTINLPIVMVPGGECPVDEAIQVVAYRKGSETSFFNQRYSLTALNEVYALPVLHPGDKVEITPLIKLGRLFLSSDDGHWDYARNVEVTTVLTASDPPSPTGNESQGILAAWRQYFLHAEVYVDIGQAQSLICGRVLYLYEDPPQ